MLAGLAALSLSTMLGCGGGQSASFSQQPPPTGLEVPLTRLSTDTFTNPSSQHATEVEASTSAFGSTIVSAFQVGRIFSGGAADIGFATSTDAGVSWTSGFLPGTTIFAGGSSSAISDPAVAFDAAHGVWMIASLPIAFAEQVAVSRSTDGVNWQNPIIVSATPHADKDWIACDNTSGSPFFGHCYVEWDDPGAAGLIRMTTSTDGGLTWGPALTTADFASGIGGQPVVQPNGTVVVPIEDWSGTRMLAYTSTDGGASWNTTGVVSTIADHFVAGNLRTSPLPSAQVDAGGTVYLVWQDCRFRAGCASNDLVMSTSTDGISWTAPTRIPIDSVRSTADHFIPGLGVDPATSGITTHLALTYYYYPSANCTASTCRLNAGFISSPDGGTTWTAPVTLAGPMTPNWLPNTFAGLMVGDYASSAFAAGKAFGVFAVARANSGGVFDEPMYTTTSGFVVAGSVSSLSSAGEQPVAGAKSDHSPRQFYDQENRYPVKPPNR
jgi:hypothetical protein